MAPTLTATKPPETKDAKDLLERPPTGGALALPESPSAEWITATLTESQIKTLVATVAPGATLDELAVFFWTARRRGLDPFLRQVHFVKRRRWNKELNDGKGGYEWVAVHQTGIDGLRVIANRAKGSDGKLLLAGIKRGPIRDERGLLTGAWAEVYRHDWTQPARVEVRWEEYVQTDNQGVPVGLWKTKPQTMIEKCAEAAALRMALPEDMGDLYINEELDSAEHVRARTADEPEPATSATAPTPELLDAQGAAVPLPGPTEREPRGLFDEAPAEESPEADRAARVKKIQGVLASFKSAPTADVWRAICLAMTGVGPDDLMRADPSAIGTLHDWLATLRRAEECALAKQPLGEAEKKAIARLREITKPVKPAGNGGRA